VELTETEWTRLRPLLPPQRPRVGRPRHDHRLVLGGILWVVRNGASWRDMPLRYGKWERAYRRYRLWSDTGLWEQILRALRSAANEEPTEVLL
jgi:transposase